MKNEQIHTDEEILESMIDEVSRVKALRALLNGEDASAMIFWDTSVVVTLDEIPFETTISVALIDVLIRSLERDVFNHMSLMDRHAEALELFPNVYDLI